LFEEDEEEEERRKRRRREARWFPDGYVSCLVFA
jgi:hypothetical protein